MLESRTWPAVIASLLEGENLSVSEASWAMDSIVSGEASPAQLAGFLVALRAKGETVDEVVGFRDAILDHALPLDVGPRAVDIVGTGGDQRGTVNVSTMASIVVASTGIPVLKHGNKAASSSSGSSDVLSALGINLALEPRHVAAIFETVGIAFVFAALFHPGFRHAAPVRTELAVPTVFNFLGPLCNPARPHASAVGVATLERVPLFTGVFQTRGATALVFRGDDGLDELTTTGHSRVWEVSGGSVKEHDLDPRELGIPLAKLSDLVGGDPEHNARVVREILSGETGPVRDIVTLNAAAGIVAFELSENPSEGDRGILERFDSALIRAREAIDSGASLRKLEEWVNATQRASRPN